MEDEDYQLRYEIAAGIDVAKESAVVCVRMPPAAGRKHRTSHLQAVPATVPAIGELAAELKAAGVQMVTLESTLVISSPSKFLLSSCSSELLRTRLRR